MISPNPDFAGADDVSDESLMQGITDRFPSALSEFYSRHRGKLKSIVGSVVKEESDADDVLQETMLQIWREASRYSPTAGKPLSWVATIARRRAIDRVRRGECYRHIKERYANDVEQPPIRGATGMGDAVVQQDLRTFLNRQLQKLPTLQHQVVRLAFFNGLSHREIATQTGTPLGTVKTRLELGLQKLTQSMRPLVGKV